MPTTTGSKTTPLAQRRGAARVAIAVVCIFLIIRTGGLIAAQSEHASCSVPAERKQFDFWVGTWRVTENGVLAGHNHIEKIDGGCALFESWTGVDGLTGHSLNIYDAGRAVWHQTWVDGHGSLLLLDGSFHEGSMILEGSSPGSEQGTPRTDRITWTPLPNGNVRQHWQRSSDGGRAWTTVFDGLYMRVAASKSRPHSK